MLCDRLLLESEKMCEKRKKMLILLIMTTHNFLSNIPKFTLYP